LFKLYVTLSLMADYIAYIELTPHVVDSLVLFSFTLTIKL